MARTLFAVLVCLGVAAASISAAGSQSVDALMRQYDAADVAQGKIQVSTAGDLAYVTGTSPAGPWLKVWRLIAGEWKMVAEVTMTELAPIRFGAKRPCRRIS